MQKCIILVRRDSMSRHDHMIGWKRYSNLGGNVEARKYLKHKISPMKNGTQWCSGTQALRFPTNLGSNSSSETNLGLQPWAN